MYEHKKYDMLYYISLVQSVIISVAMKITQFQMCLETNERQRVLMYLGISSYNRILMHYGNGIEDERN